VDSRTHKYLALNFEQPDRVPLDLWLFAGFARKLTATLGITVAEFLNQHDVDLQHTKEPTYIGPPLKRWARRERVPFLLFLVTILLAGATELGPGQWLPAYIERVTSGKRSAGCGGVVPDGCSEAMRAAGQLFPRTARHRTIPFPRGRRGLLRQYCPGRTALARAPNHCLSGPARIGCFGSLADDIGVGGQ